MGRWRVLFFVLILKNLMRQLVRAGPTMIGIAIGITTVVAPSVITDGVKESPAEPTADRWMGAERSGGLTS